MLRIFEHWRVFLSACISDQTSSVQLPSAVQPGSAACVTLRNNLSLGNWLQEKKSESLGDILDVHEAAALLNVVSSSVQQLERVKDATTVQSLVSSETNTGQAACFDTQVSVGTPAVGVVLAIQVRLLLLLQVEFLPFEIDLLLLYVAIATLWTLIIRLMVGGGLSAGTGDWRA